MVRSITRERGAVVLLALGALISQPGAGLAASGRVLPQGALEGQLVVLHADDFAAGRSTNTHAVMTADGNFVEADVSRLRGVDRMLGRTVALTGESVGSEFVATGDLGSPQAAATTVSAAAARRTAVILVNFTNDNSQPWTKATATSTVFGDSGSVASYYREVSYGATTFDGTVTDWLSIPYDNTSCRYSDWGTAALKASGVDPAQYANVVYAFPRTTACTWAGLSTIGGKYSWINGAMTVRTVGHELAHDLGVHHASALYCTSNGVHVTLSSTCTRSEYGDPFSIMGTGTNHLSAWNLAQIGWLPDTRTITSSGFYTISPTELAGQPRLMRVARGDGTFLYFDFRQPFGAFDPFAPTAAVVNGVTIRIAPDMPTRTQSLLLDMKPSTPAYDDAPLMLGKSFTDPMSGITISTTSVSSSGATISVQWPGASLPSPSPTATPSPTPTASPSPSPSSSPSTTPTASPSPSPSASATPTPSPSPSPTPSSSPSATPTPTPTPTASPPTSANDELTAPTHVKAVRLDGRKVKITWAAGAGSVVGYRVFCNGVRLGKTTSLRFFDWVPRDVTRARYFVRALDRWGRMGPQSATFTLRMR